MKPTSLVSLSLRFIIVLVCVALLPACNDQTKAALKDAAGVIGKDTVASLASAAQADLANGSKLNTTNLAFAAVQGLYGGVTQATQNGDAATIIRSFSENSLPATAKAAKAVPLTNQALAAAAAVIASVAGAPPAK